MSENQEIQLLNSIISQIRKTSELMKKSIEKKDLRQTLKYCEEIISQLKTDFFSPQLYYQLFAFVFEEILQIQSFFKIEIKNGRNAFYFYKSVQQCITVLPRVYLMIIVGSLLLEEKNIDTNEVLVDLIEACNSVQHPIRGLFVRYFFLKILKDYLFEIDILMTNFKEMNKLWIRINKIDYYPKIGIKNLRNDLKVLIGENIMRFGFVMNHLISKDKKNNENIYKDKILLPILNIIKDNEDEISQEYILICLIQVFNEEYNIKNIDIIINTLNEIKENIDIKIILIDLMEKLSKYKDIKNLKSMKIKDIFEKINALINDIANKYLDKINNILKENNDINTSEENKNENKNKNYIKINEKELIKIIELQSCFLKFIIYFGSAEFKKEIIDIINKTLDKCYELLNSINKINEDNPNISITTNNLKPENIKILYNLLNILIDSPISVIQFKSFPNLMNYLNIIFKNDLLLNILNSLTNKYNLGTINNKEKLKKLLEFIEPMIQVNHTQISEYLLDKSIYRISKLFFVPTSKDPYEQLEMLQMVKNVLIDSTKNNIEYLSNKKLLVYFNNYINCLCLFGLNISEAYDNIINNQNNKSKKSKVHLDFCNNFNFDNKNFNIKKEETFFPFYNLLFKEINSIFDIIKPLSIELSLKLYIQCSQMVNGIKFEDIDKYENYAFEYINNAISILKIKKEEIKKNEKLENNNNTDNIIKNDKNNIEVIEDNKKFNYLTNIIAAVSTMDIFTDEHFSSICSDIEAMSEGLIKRNEQCLLMLRCINLYCNAVEEDTNKIVELFQKAKKYAVYSMTSPENTILFVYILNEYIRLDGIIKNFDKTIKVNDVEEIIETIKNYIITMKNENRDSNMIKKIEDYFNNTIENIKKRKEEKNGKIYKLISTLKI